MRVQRYTGSVTGAINETGHMEIIGTPQQTQSKFMNLVMCDILIHIYNLYMYTYIYTGKPPPGSRNQQFTGQLVHWSARSLVNWFTGQLIHCFAARDRS